jgi:hypothetical protein
MAPAENGRLLSIDPLPIDEADTGNRITISGV